MLGGYFILPHPVHIKEIVDKVGLNWIAEADAINIHLENLITLNNLNKSNTRSEKHG